MIDVLLNILSFLKEGQCVRVLFLFDANIYYMLVNKIHTNILYYLSKFVVSSCNYNPLTFHIKKKK